MNQHFSGTKWSLYDSKSILGGVLSCASLLSSAGAQSAIPQQSPPTHFEQWRNSRVNIYMNDFGELARYRDENARLPSPAPGGKRVVFFGDSITDIWPLAEYFPGKPYINRGISGQTTAQMLVRFRQDVIALQPKAVVILAGTNDIAGNTGPTRIEDIEANFTSLAELAKANRIAIVFPRCFRSIITPPNRTTSSPSVLRKRLRN